MYAIYTRTKREPFFIHDDERGAKLQEQWVHGTLPKRLQIGDWVGEADTIKAIEKSGKDSADDDWVEKALNAQKDSYSEYIQKINQEYRQYHNERKNRGIAVNASDFAVVNLVWRAVVGDINIPKDATEAIVERQRAFLESHPTLTFANPTCYKDIVQKHDRKKDRRDEVFAKATMGMVERILAADMREARFDISQ